MSQITACVEVELLLPEMRSPNFFQGVWNRGPLYGNTSLCVMSYTCTTCNLHVNTSTVEPQILYYVTGTRV